MHFTIYFSLRRSVTIVLVKSTAAILASCYVNFNNEALACRFEAKQFEAVVLDRTKNKK